MSWLEKRRKRVRKIQGIDDQLVGVEVGLGQGLGQGHVEGGILGVTVDGEVESLVGVVEVIVDRIPGRCPDQGIVVVGSMQMMNIVMMSIRIESMGIGVGQDQDRIQGPCQDQDPTVRNLKKIVPDPVPDPALDHTRKINPVNHRVVLAPTPVKAQRVLAAPDHVH